MSASTGSLRTIWIEIRALNYTMNVFSDVIRQINMMQKAEETSAIASMNMAKAALSAGLLFGVLSQQVGGVGGQLLKYGSYVMYAIAGMQLMNSMLQVLDSGLMLHEVQVLGVTTTWGALYITIAAVVGIFFVLYEALNAMRSPVADAISIIGGLIIALIALVTLEGMASMGVALAGIAAGAAGAAALVSQYSGFSFASGTRSAPETGPMLIHKGEIIYNPSTGRPTQIGNELAGTNGNNYSEMSVRIDTVNTKSDIDDVDQKLRKINRTIAQNRR